MVEIAALRLVATPCTELERLLGEELTDSDVVPEPAREMVTPAMALPSVLVGLMIGTPLRVSDALVAACARISPLLAVLELGLKSNCAKAPVPETVKAA